jgi:hypothetical protein
LKEANLDAPAPAKHPAKREGFWKRQFSNVGSTRQTIFDVAAGAVIPILLLIFDPAVFHQLPCYGTSPLVNYAGFAYVAIGLGVLALLTWLFVGHKRQVGAAFFAGVLLTGGLFATVTGIALVPTSILGLFACIGVLGFFPFVTALVYFRNGVRAYRAAALESANRTRLIAAMLVGCVLVLGIPALAHPQVSTIIQGSQRNVPASSCNTSD